MAVEYLVGGRKVSQSQWEKELDEGFIDHALSQIEEWIHGLAASIVDPETQKHPVVRVRRERKMRITIQTDGSETYASLLNGLLQKEGVFGEMTDPDEKNVYFAHATEDKEIARPIAETLLQNGIEVWFDEWEMGAGDSLWQKINEGLGNCTHFVVLLTETSVQKPWVKEEIGAGFVRKVKEECEFIGLRYRLGIDQLPPLLQAYIAPEIDPEKPETVQRLIDDIHGVSRKPPLGKAPQYVKVAPKGLEGWSKAALAIARLFVEKSETGTTLDPDLSMEKITEAIDLSTEAAKDGLMDLVDRGLLREHLYVGRESWSPENDLFVEFDEHFTNWNPKDDALVLARESVKLAEGDSLHLKTLAESLDWPVRRVNSAVHYLGEARLVENSETLGSHPFTCHYIRFGHRLRRYVREHS